MRREELARGGGVNPHEIRQALTKSHEPNVICT